MRRGEIYRVANPSSKGPKRFRFFVIVSRQVLIDSSYSTVICAPVYTAYDELATQVPVGEEDGVKHDSSIHCDNLISLQKSVFTNFIATLSAEKIEALDRSLAVALDLSPDS